MSASVMPCTPGGRGGGHSSISPSKTVSAGPVISTLASSAPAHSIVQLAAARLHVHAAVQPAQPDAGHHRGAGAGAAGQRLAGAALVHAQADDVARDSTCMKPALTRRGKRAWLSMRGPEHGHRRGVDVVHALHRVRVAHRQHGHLDVRAAVQRPQLEVAFAPRHQARGVERDARELEDRAVHVDRDAAVVLQVQLEHVVDGLDAHAWSCRSGRARARSARSSARRCRSARPRRRCCCRCGSGSRCRACGWARRPGSGRRRRRSGGRPGGAPARGVSSSGARVASSTTKSLPAPCILVNCSRMARIMASAAPASAGRGARFSRRTTARPAAAS